MRRLKDASFLEWALVLTLAAHALAMVGMLALLLPGMPGGGTAEVSARAAYVAAHPWRWRLGWFPWQLTAASDLLLGVALLRSPRIPRAAAWATMLLTLLALVPDQGGQFLWITRGVTLAQEAVATGDATAYAAFEARIFLFVAGWAATLYTAGAVGWSVCFALAGLWSRTLTWLSIALWTLFGVISPALLLPPAWRAPDRLVSVGNALGFVLLEIWFVLVLLEVARARQSRAAPIRG